MRAARLQDALERLIAAIRDVESELTEMKAEQDPLASHIFVSRRHYRNVADTKSGKRCDTIARLSFNTACELGFRGGLDLQPQEGFVVPKGVVHRTRAPDRAVILLVETAAIVPTGDA